MYLRKNCDTRPYAYKIMKTLEKGLGAEEARACMEEIEASKDDNISVFNPEAWVQLLQEESLVNALAYINNNKKVAIIRNDLIKVVCNTLINGPSIPSVQDIRQLGIFEYADEQRDWLLTFATNTDSVAAKTLLIYLYLKKEQKGEAVLLNRELQKKKPKVQLSAEEDALYNQCQELEDKVYDLEPALARELPPEIALFPPGQARPPYQNFLREHGINAARLLLGPILSKRLEEANKRLREETAAEGQNPNKYRKL
ncbi:hypothetical protein BDA99DRAFT_312938 [Phascolomyces articulosus]|uniref:Uncharacterized protein n=1 Tax=Phascolomyces articulosus TaxID=60185 RepID=A0AAD5JWF7_9FUNG|nr:hypothetical protein BDA99DRAFT_312938 [Phascolomyces articulosus]